MYAKIINNEIISYPYGPSELCRDNLGISFPAVITDALLEEFNIFPVTSVTPPTYLPSSQVIVRATPTFNGDTWYETWEIVELTSDQIIQATADKEAQIRAHRNYLLSESDWTQLSDSPVDKQEWSTYRQALRDITSQSGFPFDVIWPVK